jgi:endonuclease/exonuclease/phosphatase family metal-dependent hydrolase
MIMKNLLICFFLLLAFSCSKSENKREDGPDPAEGTWLTIRFATYNIGYDNPKATDNLWINRVPLMVDLVKKKDFDIWGIQEGLQNQLTDLSAGLPQYEWFGAGRTDGHNGERCAIFYKPAKFEKLKTGDFWLSATPDNPGIGWDASLPRICTWGQFKEKTTGITFFVFNTHLDDKGSQARREGLALILNQMNKIAGNSPALLCGDFNFDQYDANYVTLKVKLTDAYDIAAARWNATTGTYNGYNINHNSSGRIDHVFLTSGMKSSRYEIVNESYSGKYPSDHFPVQNDLSIKN